MQPSVDADDGVSLIRVDIAAEGPVAASAVQALGRPPPVVLGFIPPQQSDGGEPAYGDDDGSKRRVFVDLDDDKFSEKLTRFRLAGIALSLVVVFFLLATAARTRQYTAALTYGRLGSPQNSQKLSGVESFLLELQKSFQRLVYGESTLEQFFDIYIRDIVGQSYKICFGLECLQSNANGDFEVLNPHIRNEVNQRVWGSLDYHCAANLTGMQSLPLIHYEFFPGDIPAGHRLAEIQSKRVSTYKAGVLSDLWQKDKAANRRLTSENMASYIGQFPPKIAIVLPTLNSNDSLPHSRIWEAWLERANDSAALYIPKKGLNSERETVNRYINYVSANLTPSPMLAVGSTLSYILADDLHYQWVIVLHDAYTVPIRSAESMIKNLSRNRRSRFAFTTAPAPMFYRAHRPDYVLSRTHAAALADNTHIWGCDKPIHAEIDLPKNVVNRPAAIRIGLPTDQYLVYGALTEIYGPADAQEQVNHGEKVVPSVADHVLYGPKSWELQESFVFECLTSGIEGSRKKNCCGLGSCSAVPNEDKLSYDTLVPQKLAELVAKPHFWFLGPLSPNATLEESTEPPADLIIRGINA